MQPIIVIGDKTSHGGTVITCSPTCDTHGKGWARIGDKVSCPRCKGIFPIVQGDATLTDTGVAVAYHGCKVACGATLIAAQQFTFTRPAKGGASGAGGTAGAAQEPRSRMAGPIGSGLAATYEDESLPGERFRGRFQLVDGATGKPVAGRKGRIRSTGGQYIIGITDANGFTEWIERDAAEALAFDLQGEEPA